MFTKGPWKARNTPSRVPGVDDLWCIDWNDDQEEVAEIVHGKANAVLIASAPELIEALSDLLMEINLESENGIKASTESAKKLIDRILSDANTAPPQACA